MMTTNLVKTKLPVAASCLLAILALAACGTPGTSDGAMKDGRDVATGKSANVERAAVAATHTIGAGTRIEVEVSDALSSRVNKPGETVRTTVRSDVMDERGKVAIPAGSRVVLEIVQLEPGSSQVRPEGRLVLEASSIAAAGTTYPLVATLGDIPHEMVGRGITTDEAARVGAGTAIGAVVGQAIGKNTKSTEIGGAVGAIAGTAVAVRYAYRDVVVRAGTVIVLTLVKPLEVSAR